MYNFYNPKHHYGTQPIRVLQHNISKITNDLCFKYLDSFPKILKQNSHKIKFKYYAYEEAISYKTENFECQTPQVSPLNEILLHETFLSYLWCISYGLFTLFDKTIIEPTLNKKYPLSFKEYPHEAKKARKLINYAHLLRNQFKRWDTRLPNPEIYLYEDKYYIERANNVFLHAVSFIILHEMAHIELGHVDKYNEYEKAKKSLPIKTRLKFEYEADHLALKTLLEERKTTQPKLRTTIETGLISGLCSIVFLNNSLMSLTHPDSDERLKTVIESLNLDEIDHMWGIASLGLNMWSHNQSLKINQPSIVENFKENFYITLNELNTLK